MSVRTYEYDGPLSFTSTRYLKSQTLRPGHRHIDEDAKVSKDHMFCYRSLS